MTEKKGVVHVIDDDASWRKSVQRLLSALGYGVALYEAAEQFLEGLDTDGWLCPPHMRMSGSAGWSSSNALPKASRVADRVRSGHGDIPTSVLAMKSGAGDFW
jgi:FixJ family two-component response regulator